MIAEALRPHQDAVARLAEVPGFGVSSARLVIAEVGAQASTFPSAAHLASWVGACPGKQESAEQNHCSRSAKGNKYLCRVLTESAQAAVKTKGSHLQAVFRHLLPRLGYRQAVCAVAHCLCQLIWKVLHQQVSFTEPEAAIDGKAKQRPARILLDKLRKLGYAVTIASSPAIAGG
jgi:transposase